MKGKASDKLKNERTSIGHSANTYPSERIKIRHGEYESNWQLLACFVSYLISRLLVTA
jgi:hypothetical protein